MTLVLAGGASSILPPHSAAPVGTGFAGCRIARPLSLCPPPPAARRKWGGHPPASQDAADETAPAEECRPPEGRSLPANPAQPLFYVINIIAPLCPHLLRGHPHLLPSCQGYLVLVGRGARGPSQRHREQRGQNGTVTWHQVHGLLVGRGLPHGEEVGDPPPRSWQRGARKCTVAINVLLAQTVSPSLPRGWALCLRPPQACATHQQVRLALMLEPTSFPPFSGTQGTALLPLPTILNPRDLGN